MDFQIVVHCNRYGRLLAYQLSSLILHNPENHNIKYTLFWDRRDGYVRDVVEYFSPILSSNGITFDSQNQGIGLLRNRGYGRNLAAKSNTADWVWFADCDYTFNTPVWYDLERGSNENPGARFIKPRYVRETSWEKGDELIQQMDELAVRQSPVMSVALEYKPIAIGGIQIAFGETLRSCGYCPWIKPRRKRNWDFRSDIYFRKQPEMQNVAEVNLDGLVRIRHTNKGYGQRNAHKVVN
jgi:hypothetical protein